MGVVKTSESQRTTSLCTRVLGSQRDAASTIFNLPNYRVIDAVDLPDGRRRR